LDYNRSAPMINDNTMNGCQILLSYLKMARFRASRYQVVWGEWRMTTDDDGEISKKDPKIGNGLAFDFTKQVPHLFLIISQYEWEVRNTSDVLTISFKHRSHPSSKSIIEAWFYTNN
jgi:hypothetical protein